MKTSASTIGGGSSERRRYTRYPFTGTLEAVEPESETKIQGRTTDLSEGGCYVDTLNPFPAQTCVKVRLTKEGRSFESQAKVVYSAVGMGMGLQFEAIDPEQLVTLRKWLHELSGEGTAEVQIEENNTSAYATAGPDSALNELAGSLVCKGAVNDTPSGGMLQPLCELV